MADPAQPLNKNFPIIDPQTGAPTEYFIRWAQQFSGSAGSSLEALQEEIDNLDLDDLTDVDVSTNPPSNNQVLGYDDGQGLWTPRTPAGGGGWTPTTPVAADFSIMRKYSALGTPTIQDVTRGTGVLWIAPRNTGSGWEQSYLFKPAPAGPQWRVEAILSAYKNSTSSYFQDGIGVGTTTGSDTKHISLRNTYGGSSSTTLGRIATWPDLNDNTDGAYTPGPVPFIRDEFYSFPVFYALEYDQPTLTFLMSTDGYSWADVGSMDADAYVGGPIDLVGFAHMSVSAASGEDYTFCPHWKETTNLSDPLGKNIV